MSLQHLRIFKGESLTLTRLSSYLIAGLRLKLERLLYGVQGDSTTMGVVLWNKAAQTWSLRTVASATNAAVDISGVAGSVEDRMIDGVGRLVEPGAVGTFQVLDSAGVDYALYGLAIDVPDQAVERDYQPGVYDYDRVNQICGYQAAPDSVADSGGGVLKIVVDSVLDSGEGDCTALTDTVIRVYLAGLDDGGLVGPQGTSGWSEDLAIQWDGANNYINTTTYLGQATPSTTASDYVVAAIGPICRRTATGGPTGSAIFAWYTGAGPAAPVTAVIDWERARDYGSSVSPRCWPRDGGNDSHHLVTRNGVKGHAAAYPAGLVYVNVADSQTITNTVAATDFDKKFQIPANTLRAGSVVRVRLNGLFDAYASGTVTIGVVVAGEVGGWVAITPTANDQFHFDCEMIVRGEGAAADYSMNIQQGTGAAAPALLGYRGTGTIDTTGALDCKVTVTWSAADAGNQVTLKHISVEIGRVPNL